MHKRYLNKVIYMSENVLYFVSDRRKIEQLITTLVMYFLEWINQQKQQNCISHTSGSLTHSVSKKKTWRTFMNLQLNKKNQLFNYSFVIAGLLVKKKNYVETDILVENW